MIRPFLALLLANNVLGQVAFTHAEDRVQVTIANRPFTTLHFGKEARKPFLFPLSTPSGVKITRGFPLEPNAGDPTDHPHQKGLWTGTEQLNGIDFWENDPSYSRPRMGTILFRDVTRAAAGADSGSLAYAADWISPEGKNLVAESHSLRFSALSPTVNAIDVDFTLTSRSAEPLLFEDHQDAIIGVRLGPAFDERTGAYPENAEGYRGEAGIRGRASRWVDWRAKIDGKLVGLAILDHPSNYNSPARWHLRSFGFLACNPFARKSFDFAAPSGEKELKPGESLRLRYRVLVHDGPIDLKTFYREFSGSQLSGSQLFGSQLFGSQQ